MMHKNFLARNSIITGSRLLKYRDRPQLALTKHLTAFIRAGIFPSLEAFKPMVHLLLKHSIQSRQYDLKSLARWTTYQTQPSQMVYQSLPTDHASSLQTLGEQLTSRAACWVWQTNYASVSAWWYSFVSPRSTQGNPYKVLNLFRVDLGKLAFYQITLLSITNQALVKLPGYTRIFVDDEASTPLTGSPGVLIRIRSAIFSFRISSSYSILSRRRQARKSTTGSPAMWRCWVRKLCLFICLGIVIYCITRALELEQDVYWSLKHQRNQESRRAYKNSRIRSTFRPA